jgi:secondary thiamine-phosphate synthase enzyme
LPKATEAATIRDRVRTHQAEREVRTETGPSFSDITEMVEDEVARSGVSSGQVTVFVPATACAIVVNERESGLMDDISRTLRRLESHSPPAAQTVIGSASVVLPAVDGRLRLGTWQRVLLIDLEGAVDRPVVVQIVGD